MVISVSCECHTGETLAAEKFQNQIVSPCVIDPSVARLRTCAIATIEYVRNRNDSHVLIKMFSSEYKVPLYLVYS